MRQEQLKEQITQLQKENLNVEGELNKLHNDKTQSIKKLEMLEKNLGFKNRRIDEIKRDVFNMTIELNKLNFEQQKKDATEFLKINFEQLKTVFSFGLLAEENPTIDFGITTKMHEVFFVHSDYLHPELLKLAGNLNFGIEISQYQPSTEDYESE